jgi:hypothetical protein
MLPRVLAAILLQSLALTPARLKGQTVDFEGAPIQAQIRLVNPLTGAEILRLSTTPNGEFQANQLPPGSYLLTAHATPFLTRERKLTIESGITVDLGAFTMNAVTCDAPGIMCDTFGMTPTTPDRIIAHSSATMQLNGALDLDRNRQLTQPAAKDPDLRLTKQNGTLYLEAINGAAISAPFVPTIDCRDVAFPNKTLPIDTFGKGVGVCIHTSNGAYSHLFFTTHIDETTTAIGLTYTTRPKR